MIHYLMVRFTDDYFTDDVYADFQDTYAQMVWDQDGVEQVCIKAGQRIDNDNADIMVRLSLKNTDALGLYLVSDERRGLIARHGRHIENVSVFNTEVDVCDCT